MSAPDPFEKEELIIRETDYSIKRLRDRISLWKSFGCLSVTFSKPAVMAEEFRICVRTGVQKIQKMLQKSALKNAESQSRRFNSFLRQLCSSESTLCFVYHLLRLAEMTDGLPQVLPPKLQAQTCLCLVGELHHLRNQLFTQAANPEAGSAESGGEVGRCCELLRTTENQLISFIIQIAKDEVGTLRRKLLLGDSPSAETDFALTVYPQESGGNSLERLLMEGSLFSMWNALHKTAPKNIQRALESTIFKMNRFRQLLFTRLLEALCTKMYAIRNKNSIVEIAANPKLVKLVFQNFLRIAENTKTLWSYESKAQLQTFERSNNLCTEDKNRLKSIFILVDTFHLSSKQQLIEYGAAAPLALSLSAYPGWVPGSCPAVLVPRVAVPPLRFARRAFCVEEMV